MYTAETFLSTVSVSTHDPKFAEVVHRLLASREVAPPSSLREQAIWAVREEYEEISREMDVAGVQESASARILLRSRALASLFINEAGEWEMEAVQAAQEELRNSLYSLSPSRRFDNLRNQHLLQVCTLLVKEKNIRQQIRSIHRPASHRVAEQMIRDSLQIPPDLPLTDCHARRAALSAWMCYLRQNVGSCFATAPAILIQHEQPDLLLHDLQELLATGRLRRVYGGIEYAVPLAASWGSGDLRRTFVIQKEHALAQLLKMATAPAMKLAYAAANIPSSREELKTALKQFGKTLFAGKTEIAISSETLLKSILLHAYDLLPDELQSYLERPSPMMLQGSLMAYSPNIPKGKNGRLEHFCAAFERACSSYKALTEHALLRAWEFTLASFSETKAQFSTWNLYSSLGLSAEEAGGLGEKLYDIVQQRWEESKIKIDEYQTEYEMLYGQLVFCEGRLKNASTEQEARFLRAEYESKRNEFYLFEQMRNRAVTLTNQYAGLFSQLVDSYLGLFPEFFQEVYDPDLREVAVGPYDDSPAGFRLLCKHGRTNTALWTLIYTRAQFVEALAAFFVFAETTLAQQPEWEIFSSDLGTITTTIVNHVRSEEFLISALQRMAAAHGARLPEDPLNHLDQIEKKPWAYTSGGTMDTLVSCYFCREEKPTEKGRWVENEAELATFLIDCVRQIPEKQLKAILSPPGRYLLMHSPTHAFLLKPSFALFASGVQDTTYTYIWLRDQVIEPQKRMLYGMILERTHVQLFLSCLAKQLPAGWSEEFSQLFSFVPEKMRSTEMRSYIMQELQSLQGWRWRSGVIQNEMIDSLLYRMLPIVEGSEVTEKLHALFMALPGMTACGAKRLCSLYETGLHADTYNYCLGADQLQAIALSLLSLEEGNLRSSYDVQHAIARAAQTLGFALSTPLLFADSNWVTDFFGFAVNPGDGEFSLWRFDYTGSIGAPISSWKHWLDGSNQQRTWGIYVRPSEYETTHLF